MVVRFAIIALMVMAATGIPNTVYVSLASSYVPVALSPSATFSTLISP